MWNFLSRGTTLVMLLCAGISLVLWYLNMLNHNYTTTLTLPVVIENTPESNVGVVGGNYRIDCRVEGPGYTLFRQKYFPRPIHIGVDRIRTAPFTENGGEPRNEIVLSTLLTALSVEMTDLKVLSIVSPRIEITVAPLKTKQVPVISRIEVDPRNQFMQVGSTLLKPARITVKSLGEVLDTLQGIYTERLTLRDVRSNLSGEVPLVPVDGVILPVQSVAYELYVEPYTEITLELPVEPTNVPAGYKPLVIPAQAQVRFNVARSASGSKGETGVKLYIDAAQQVEDRPRYYKIYVENSPGYFVKELDPYYVELYLEEENPKEGGR